MLVSVKTIEIYTEGSFCHLSVIVIETSRKLFKYYLNSFGQNLLN